MFCHASAIHPTAEAGQARYGLSGAIPVIQRQTYKNHGQSAYDRHKTLSTKEVQTRRELQGAETIEHICANKP